MGVYKINPQNIIFYLEIQKNYQLNMNKSSKCNKYLSFRMKISFDVARLKQNTMIILQVMLTGKQEVLFLANHRECKQQYEISK